MNAPVTYRLSWQDFTLEIRHTPRWLNLDHDHVEIIAVSPERAALPITETGYRSHFLHGQLLTEEGGPVAYVTAWLDAASQAADWKARAEAARQGSLF
jgi:hypothetical protein